MKWMYAINQKTKVALWATLILLIFFVINWKDKKNVNTLDSSFSSVYEDRLLVESYIFLLSDHLYQKKIILSACGDYLHPEDLNQTITRHNQTISTLLIDYEKTKLTQAESFYFDNLKQNLVELEKLEEQYLRSVCNASDFGSVLLSNMQKDYEQAILDLNQLSKIQIAEAKVLKDESKKIVAGSILLTQFELVIIIGVAVLIQILIFSSKSTIPKKPQQYHLN